VGFSVREWLSSFVLDAVIKFVVIAFISVLFSLGMVGWSSGIAPALTLSLFHFLCLFLGFSLIASLELAKIDLRAGTRFWLGLLVGNVLFGAAINTLFALDLRKSVLELSSATVGLVITNLTSILTVAAVGCLCRRVSRSRASAE
jgi:hypothetical protein